ncbi:universal stress protein [Peribacillus sp. SCS-26]|uniref:universal stress protein n=1 Tax=Paraperibacillus marinus TaxID=3115295 RepID=UPI003906B2B6
MNAFTHIAVAYDGTIAGKEAVEMAAAMKKNNVDAKLTVLHVYDPATDDASGPHPAMAKENLYVDPTQMQPVVSPPISFDQPGAGRGAGVQVDHLAETENTVKDTLGLSAAEAEFEILDGSTAEAICQFAERNRVDLLIVGSSGKSGLKRFFSGSVSEAVVKDAPCSVLVAR